MKRSITTIAKSILLGCALVGVEAFLPIAFCQEPANRESGGAGPFGESGPARQPMFLPYAQFQIPFNVDSNGAEPALVQLWVSTDEGLTWQMHGSEKPEAKHFQFRAASEGLYLFSVHTVDASGANFPSMGPPLYVQVDTTKPQAAIRADIDASGNLVVDIRVADSHLDLNSAILRVRTDREANWRDVAVESLTPVGEVFEGRAIARISPCREVAIVFAIKDQADNSGEATFSLTMPRTAAGEQDMKLASTGAPPRNGQSGYHPAGALQPIEGATPWEPDSSRNAESESKVVAESSLTGSPLTGPPLTGPPLTGTQRSVGKLIGTDAISTDAPSSVEELPLPAPERGATLESGSRLVETELLLESNGEQSAREPRKSAPIDPPVDPRRESELSDARSAVGQAYHCQSRAFSLDYSVEALGGGSLEDVELWGTEDGGRTWNQWGSDPDRQSPFDVQVGNDGLFGFRMVIVGSNGIVSNRPKDGDSSDVWINIDTAKPSAKITRAVYGEGPEDGLLVIDYGCNDSHLVDRPITLSFSERTEGPWTTIAAGLKNTGIYLWKAAPNLPDRIYLKLEAVDKAGNIGAHRLELPIDIKGLAPRGRIQGFRPIKLPQ